MRTPRKLLHSCKAIVGKIVVLKHEVRLRNNHIYMPGSRWRVSSTWRGRFNLVGVTKSGRTEIRFKCISRFMRQIHRSDFEVVS